MGLRNSLGKIFGYGYDDDDEYYDDEEMQEDYYEPEPTINKKNKKNDIQNDNTLELASKTRKNKAEVILVRPESFDEVATIGEHLNQKKIVVLNLEVASKEVGKRLIDFLSGVAFANQGKIQKIATNTFIIVPYNVDMTGIEVLTELSY